MLPLDMLTPEAKAAFEAHGVDPDKLDVAVVLDLDESGNYGESWMAYSRETDMLYVISASFKAEGSRLAGTDPNANGAKKTAKSKSPAKNFAYFNAYNAKTIYDVYVDNFVCSNRVLARVDDEMRVIPKLKSRKEQDEQSDRKEEKEEVDINLLTTVVVAFSTNARKRKLFAFLDIFNRLRKGEEVKPDDSIFEQFNLKCPKCGRVYADQTRKICEHCLNRKAVVKRLLSYFKGFELELFTVFFCMIMTSVIALVNPLISNRILLDQVISEPDVINGRQIGTMHSEFWVYVMVTVIICISLVSLGIGILQNRANAKMSTRVTLKMKLDIFTAMQKLSLSFFNNNQTGRLITRVNYDAERVRGFFINAVPSLVINSINFIGLTIFLFIINWKLTIIVFIPVPIIVMMFKFMLPKLWRMYTKLWRRSSSLNALLGDTLNGIRVVKAFAKESEEANRFYQYSERLTQTSLQLNMVSLTIFPIIGLLIGLSSRAIWGFGGINVINRVMTYGDFATYFSYIGMIFGPLNFFTSFTDQLTDTINSAQRMFEILDAVPEITDAPDAVYIDRMRGEIEFQRVNFHYTANRPILKDVSFKINPGDHVGLVGHTGAGKSTIANLITRLYDVISGSIEIDGVNIKQIKSESLRKNIAIVSQEIFIFRGTIADNIRYARPDASMDEVVAAAKAANAHDFIMRLPDGYETIVGTGSRSLSGGECQRISIARALLLNPTILILDEATASMDTETERLIQDALTELVKGKTTITIAHRLSTLKDCNYLFAIENGEIVERGTHDELMAKKGIYYRLYTLQTEAMKKVLQGM
ncbi:MAG TPA: ABC transporter ATP-binding protein [Clostridiales bacterium]|nr:ABC transporter ATP-binding protein [Clostridiales bacterium]